MDHYEKQCAWFRMIIQGFFYTFYSWCLEFVEIILTVETIGFLEFLQVKTWIFILRVNGPATNLNMKLSEKT